MKTFETNEFKKVCFFSFGTSLNSTWTYSWVFLRLTWVIRLLENKEKHIKEKILKQEKRNQ